MISGSVEIQTIENPFSAVFVEVTNMKLESHHFTILSLGSAAFLGESDYKRRRVASSVDEKKKKIVPEGQHLL